MVWNSATMLVLFFVVVHFSRSTTFEIALSRNAKNKQ